MWDYSKEQTEGTFLGGRNVDGLDRVYEVIMRSPLKMQFFVHRVLKRLIIVWYLH